MGLRSVDAVLVFDEDDPCAVLDRLRPDVWTKGGDYDASALPELELVRSWGGRVVLLPYLAGRSTTAHPRTPRHERAVHGQRTRAGHRLRHRRSQRARCGGRRGRQQGRRHAGGDRPGRPRRPAWRTWRRTCPTPAPPRRRSSSWSRWSGRRRPSSPPPAPTPAARWPTCRSRRGSGWSPSTCSVRRPWSAPPCRTCAPAGARVVTVASTLGLRAAGDATAYCASKFGVVGLHPGAGDGAGRRGRRHAARPRGHAAPRSSTAGPSSTAPAPTPQLNDPADVAQTVLMALRQPVGCEVRELVVTAVHGAVLAVSPASYVVALRALGLGDLLTGVPALRGVRRAWPGAELALAAPEPAGRFLLELGVVDTVLPVSGAGRPGPCGRTPGAGRGGEPARPRTAEPPPACGAGTPPAGRIRLCGGRVQRRAGLGRATSTRWTGGAGW